jgi:hypothetical protein
MADLLEQAGGTEEAGDAEKTLQQKEKDQRGEDREGEPGCGMVETHGDSQ